MRTAIQKTDVYKFDELSDRAKENAIDWFREHNLDYEWWDCTFEDAKEIGKIIGIEISNIYFSGFSNQGDGACFEGYYEYKKGSVKNLKGYAPCDKELHRIAKALSKAQRKHFYELTASIKHCGHYYHEMCTRFDVNKNDEYGGHYVDAHTDDTIIEPLRDFMRWIYKQLESEYNYRQSDSQIIESIIISECEFTKDGNVY